eukprot:1192670-Prorocentrum_minimum.AAC.5
MNRLVSGASRVLAGALRGMPACSARSGMQELNRAQLAPHVDALYPRFARSFGSTAKVLDEDGERRVLEAKVLEIKNAGENIGSDRVGIGMRGDGTAPRFYKAVTVGEEPGKGYTVLLDGRKLKTPAKQDLILPTKALALAISAEWEWQMGNDIRPFTMPLMTLASTAIDRVPMRKDVIIFELLKFFHTDLACCRDESGTPLAIRQAEILDPIVAFASQKLGTEINVSDALLGAEQSSEATNALNKFLRGLSDYEMAALDAIGGVTKSTIISINILDGNISVEQAIAASRIEEDIQMEKWGLVEGGHDIDVADVRVRVASPSVFLQLAGLR